MKELNKNSVQINAQLFTQYSDIVRKIAQVRIDTRMSQDAVAEMIGVSRRIIIDFERCERYNWELFVLLCDKFGITIDIYHELE